MNDSNPYIVIILVAIVVLILLILIFREINAWYWKINERLAQQYKTNMLLEKLSILMGGTNQDEITIEEIKNGKRKKITIDKWVEFKAKNPKDKKYRIVKDDSAEPLSK